MAVKSKRQQMVDLAVLAPLDWVDERTGAVRGTKWFLFRNVPRDISRGRPMFYQRDDKYYVRTKDSYGRKKEFLISFTFGWKPL